MKTIKQRVQLSEAEAAYLVALLRAHYAILIDQENAEQEQDLNINVRMKLLKAISRCEEKTKT